MKKFDLLKILGIAFAITILLSWIIPAGAYSSGAFSSLSKTVTIGLYDIIRIPVITIATFIQYGIVFLAIGGFYGVLSKTGVLAKIVNNISESWRLNRKALLILIIVGFALLSSLLGLPTLLFILVPLFVAILLSLGYNKMTAFAATIGLILVGQIGSILGFNLWGYLAVFLSISMFSMTVARVILCMASIILFAAIVVKHSEPKTSKAEKHKKANKETKEEMKEEMDIPFLEKNSKVTTKSSTPFVVVMFIVFVLLVLGLYNWYYAFNTSVFSNLHESITSYTVGDNYTLFANLLGSFSEFGFWGNYDLVVILVIASLLLGWIYSIKLNDTLTGFKNGMKEIAPTAFYAMMASILFTAILNMSSGSFVVTIFNKIYTATGGFNFFTASIASIVSSFFYNDFYTLVNTFYGTFALLDTKLIPIMSFITEAIYALVMVIAPTSIFLLAGLKYLEIPYKEWAKYIWKFILIILVVIIAIAFILTLV